MPHLVIEYSDNLEGELDIAALVGAMHLAGCSCPTVATAALKTRAIGYAHQVCADGDPAYRFVALTMRLLSGRSDAEKQQIGDILFAALEQATSAVDRSAGFALSLELAEMDKATYRKEHNFGALMTAKASL